MDPPSIGACVGARARAWGYSRELVPVFRTLGTPPMPLKSPMTKPTSLLEGLRSRRLDIVSGKGGVGKSSVVAAMALALARAGDRVLVVEVDGGCRLPSLVGGDVPAGGKGLVAPNIWGLFLDPTEVMDAYVLAQVPMRVLAQRIVESRIYQNFVAAAPGLKELLVLGSVMMVYEGRHDVAGERNFDHILIDAPATGHGVQLLRVPSLVVDTFGEGPITREARNVVTMLRAPTTRLDIVTLAEEMPVNEALELEGAGEDLLGRPPGVMIANGICPAPGGPSLEWARGSAAASSDPLLDEAIRSVCWMGSRHELNVAYLGELKQRTKAPMFELPFVFEADEQSVVEHLARTIESGGKFS